MRMTAIKIGDDRHIVAIQYFQQNVDRFSPRILIVKPLVLPEQNPPDPIKHAGRFQ